MIEDSMSPEDEAPRKRARSGARRWYIEGVHEVQPELLGCKILKHVW